MKPTNAIANTLINLTTNACHAALGHLTLTAEDPHNAHYHTEAATFHLDLATYYLAQHKLYSHDQQDTTPPQPHNQP